MNNTKLIQTKEQTKLEYLMNLVREVKQEAMNNPTPGSAVALLATYDALLSELEKDVA